MADHVFLGNIKVEVSFDAAAVRVSRHCVPYASGFQFCESHLQLAGVFFKYIAYNQLIDHAVIAFFHLSGSKGIGFDRSFSSVNGDKLGFVSMVGSRGVQIGIYPYEDDAGEEVIYSQKKRLK